MINKGDIQMKKNILKIILLLFYCIPFVFLAMNEDVIRGTLWFYLVMIIGFGALCYGSVKIRSHWIVVAGNILSLLSTCVCTMLFQTEKWGWYFKPFTPYQSIVFETVFAFVIQIIIVICSLRKHGRKEVHKS